MPKLCHPRDEFDGAPNKQGIINIAIRKALRGEPLEIWGAGNGNKDYIYIDDACRLILQSLLRGIPTGVYNLAAGSPHSVVEIAETIKSYIPTFEWRHTRESLLDVQSFELDIAKLKRVMGAEVSFLPFSEAVGKTIEWERSQIK